MHPAILAIKQKSAPPPPPEFLLDFYPGAAAALSLRNINSNYNGNILTLRRDDNTEQSFSFVGGEFPITQILEFADGGNAFVTVLYDVSGNGRNAIQTITSSQPKIVNAGVLCTENDEPCITFDGVNDYLQLPIFTINSYSYFIVYNLKGINNYETILNTGINHPNQPNRIRLRRFSTNSVVEYVSGNTAGGLITGTKNIDNAQILTSATAEVGGDFSVYTNGEIEGTIPAGTINITSERMMIGSRYGAIPTDANFQEFIFYPDAGVDRSGIELNINEYYSIF